MSSEQTTVLVFKDRAGEYYLLPQETLERGRVPAEDRADVERLASETAGDDVAGHMLGTVGVFTLPIVAALLRLTPQETNLLDWLGQEVNSGGKA